MARVTITPEAVYRAIRACTQPGAARFVRYHLGAGVIPSKYERLFADALNKEIQYDKECDT
jgi:hypothetical protein